MRKLTYDYVKAKFTERGCELLSKEYVRSKDKLLFKCVCGNVSEITFDKFSAGQLCGKCARKRSGKRRKHTIQYVRGVFESRGCTLLTSEYKNNKQKLVYICKCGKKSEISFAKFQAGQNCRECGNRKISEKLSGENSYMYDPTKTDEERIRDRKYPEYYEWRRKVFERDSYTCQNCFESGGELNAHHIESYAKNEELRTDIENGITLCEECHKEYHTDYTRNNATEDTFLMYLRGEHNAPPPDVD